MNLKKLYETIFTEKYGSVLTNKQAIDELGLERGRDLAKILYTEELPTLRSDDVAGYKAKQSHETLELKLLGKYGRNELTMGQFSKELGLFVREAKALLTMQIVRAATVDQVVYFLEESEVINERLGKRKFLKWMYWDLKLSRNEIANILGTTEHVVQRMIDKRNLGKKKNKISPKGKIGFSMTHEGRVKRREGQPNSKKIIAVDPKTFKIVKVFASSGEVARDGFIRKNVTRSCNVQRVGRNNQGRASKIVGVVQGKYKFFWEKSYKEDLEALINAIRNAIENQNMDREKVKTIFEFSDNVLDLVCGGASCN